MIDEDPSDGEPTRERHALSPGHVRAIPQAISSAEIADDQVDRIPVRLTGGRRAWLMIPAPFFEADKARLKARIDLALTQDEEEGR